MSYHINEAEYARLTAKSTTTLSEQKRIFANRCIDCGGYFPFNLNSGGKRISCQHLEDECTNCGLDSAIQYKKVKELLETSLTNEDFMTDDIKYRNLVAVLNEAITTVKVKFSTGDKLYTCKCPKELADVLATGDQILVESNDGKIQGVYVVEVDEETDIDPQSELNYRWVICKVDRSLYEKTLALEEANVRNLQKERRKQVRRQFLEAMGVGENVKLVTKLPE